MGAVVHLERQQSVDIGGGWGMQLQAVGVCHG